MVHLIQASATSIPLPDNSVQCVVTSPPYWGLRKYAGDQDLLWGGRYGCEHEWKSETRIGDKRAGGCSTAWGKGTGAASTFAKSDGLTAATNTCILCGAWRGAYGLEPTVQMYVEHTVQILREIRRVMRPDGVCFWNVGDSYDNKNLCLAPQRVAIAAQDDGWWVRSYIIWHKPNPMPESCKDRPTDSYEPILMLTKSERYFWDKEAVAEPCTTSYTSYDGQGTKDYEAAQVQNPSDVKRRVIESMKRSGGTRNLRNVWTFPTQPYPGAHFATFPEELPRRCIKAATKPGDLVLDPFAGTGTTGRVAQELSRDAILLDINFDGTYRELAQERIRDVQKVLLPAAAAA